MRSLNSGNQPQPQDDNLADVLEVIRKADPTIFQEFFAPSAGFANAAQIPAAGMATSFPPSAMGFSPVVAVPGSKPDSNRNKKHAYVRVVEQPASKGLRFRYECEGRSAGCIPGVNTTNENKTFPTIAVVGYKGRAVVVVSCVTVDSPYRPHPHNLVGKEGCKKGVCTIEMDVNTMTCSFPSLGIQCVKKKEIEASLQLREQIRVDPFQTGFSHKDNAHSIDLNCVRLCFQVFLEGNEKGAFTFALKPVVSDPIFDKKARNDLTICRMTECNASVAGGKEILLFCEKVTKDDIQVRFFEENELGQVLWEGFGEFQPSDVHKQYGICFRTPRYHNLETEQSVHVKLQLRRPSDGAISDPRKFEFLPLDGGQNFWAAKRMKTNFNVFSNILAMGSKQISPMVLSVESTMDVADEPARRKIPTSSALMSPIHLRGAAGLNMSPRIPAPCATITSPQAPPAPPPMPTVAHVSLMTRPQLIPVQTLIKEEQDLRLPPRATPVNLRPISGMSDSILSASSMNSLASTVTGRSVNEVLSLADHQEDENRRQSFFSDFEVPNEPTNNLSIQRLIMSTRNNQEQASIIIEEQKPVVLADASPIEPMELDLGEMYDDVLQCVYDDVDVKYDDIQLGNDTIPPIPPIRKQKTIDTLPRPAPPTPDSLADASKPLPDTPSKVPAILTKLAGKKSDENKKKEKEVDKQKEKQMKKQEKLDKKKKDKVEDSGVVSPRQSLFQRLFSKSKSCEDDQTIRIDDDSSPPIPPHGEHLSTDGNGNPDGLELQIDDSELQTMIDSNNLEQLDNMVSEFAREMVGSDEDFRCVGANNNTLIASNQQRELNNNPAQQIL